MSKQSELDLFLERADEFIDSKYILADIKIANLLKSIASSETLVAVFKNCIIDFDYSLAKKNYLINNDYLPDEKGEFVLPSTSKELLSFAFYVLMDIDAKRIDFKNFLNKYFFEDGSFSASYTLFINSLIKPFKNAVKTIMEGVIDGTVQDPIEAAKKEEEKIAQEKEKKELADKKVKEDNQNKSQNGVNKIRKLLLDDKTKIKSRNSAKSKYKELSIVVDMLANVIDSKDEDAINYAFIAYKYCVKSTRFRPKIYLSKMSKLVEEVLNGV